MIIEPQNVTEIWNAITNLNHAYTAMAVDVGVLKVQVGEIVWLMRTIIAASAIFIITRFWKIVISWKNNKS